MQRLIGLALLALGTACQQPQPVDAAAVRLAIEEQNTRAERWYRGGHADSLATIFVDSAWQMPPNAPPLVGREAVKGFWTQAMTWGSWEFDFQTQDVMASGALAVERGRYAVQFTPGPKSPMPAVKDSGSYVAVWRRESDGQWRAVWDAPVSEVPPPGTPR